MNRPSKQLSAVELRIGNWLMGNSPFQVDAMQISLAESRERGGFEIGWQPILLTEEWLERFGFILRGIYYHFPYNDIFKLQQYTVKNAYWLRHSSESLDSVRINYVHQLQNLHFALTGEELTIKTN